MKFAKILTLSLAFSLAGVSLFAAGKAEDPAVIKGSSAVEIAAAEITKVSPLNVLPGTLVSIEGLGFGNKAGSIRVGSAEITEFLSWEDTCIFFRVPKGGISGPSEIRVGNAYAEDTLKPAPTGSLTVMWTVDLAALQKVVDAEWKTVYNAPAKPVFTSPMFVKGEWVKNGENYGSASSSWDGGSKVRMLRDKSGSKWFAEVVFTPDNISSFGVKAMKFAFEDGNNEERDLVPYESNIMFILKKDWAKTDFFTTVNSDPALSPSAKDKLYNKDANTIFVSYPVQK